MTQCCTGSVADLPTMGQNGLVDGQGSEQRLRVLPLSQPSTHTTLKGRSHDVNSRNN
jgi:hypothetical protein